MPPSLRACASAPACLGPAFLRLAIHVVTVLVHTCRTTRQACSQDVDLTVLPFYRFEMLRSIEQGEGALKRLRKMGRAITTQLLRHVFIQKGTVDVAHTDTDPFAFGSGGIA